MEEAAKLLSLYNEKSPLENLAIKTLIVFIPLILQKPSKNSKNKDHKEHLKRRLQLWKNGCLQSLINEGREIQKRFQTTKSTANNNISRAFTNLIFQGKIRAACKLLDHNNDGPLKINEEVLNILKEKHPKPKEVNIDTILPNNGECRVEPIAYEGIDAALIQKAAMSPRGSGVPLKLMHKFGDK